MSTTPLESVPKSYYDPATKTWTTTAPEAEAAIQCETCGQPLVRLDSGWLCATCPVLNQRIIDDAVIRTRLEPFARGLVEQRVFVEVTKMMNFLRGRSQWAGRCGVVAGVAKPIAPPAAATTPSAEPAFGANGKPKRTRKAKAAAAAATTAADGALPPPFNNQDS